jgi:hypothetical protein
VLYCSYFVFFLIKFLLSPKYPSVLPCPFLCKSHFFLVLFITEIPPKSSSSSSRKSKIQEIFRQLPKHTKPTSVLLLPQIKKLNRSTAPVGNLEGEERLSSMMVETQLMGCRQNSPIRPFYVLCFSHQHGFATVDHRNPRDHNDGFSFISMEPTMRGLKHWPLMNSFK